MKPAEVGVMKIVRSVRKPQDARVQAELFDLLIGLGARAALVLFGDGR